MTVFSKKKHLFILYFQKKKLPLFRIYIITKIWLFMSEFISSVAVTFSSDADLVVSSLHLDAVSGCTILHAMSFVRKNPTVKSYLSRKYSILNITFKYSKI
nr:MAG TPA: hypothetical protein [Microviridae sp.]